ncbi:universal stress protein [uncultured Methanoregula sp.]|uniref:universal stress protein n=1 Tax=uncultured Methanoregula sp. TaxID=1005933 RepID=UPI002AAB7DE5|nr:universal stress protein [uncultured Methanoregula sp.]
MFEKVLLPTDFSTDSQRILGYIKDIPGVRNVILLHVIDATRQSLRGWTHGPKIENAKILLEENRQALEKGGVKSEVAIATIVNTITHGDVPLTILEKADTENISLIVMGARGKNTIQNILLGSVSANVIRHAKVPILLMRFRSESCAMDDHWHLFSRVLVPLDFSGPSQYALALLKDIPTTGQVILLHVVDKGESETEIQEAVQAARERMAAIQKDLAVTGIPAEVRVHAGYPPDEINTTAERENATLILISPQGEGWTRELRAFFIGSTTNAVIRRAHCPVLIAAGIRQPDRTMS